MVKSARMVSLVRILVVLLTADQVYNEKILCWKQLKKGTDKTLSSADFHKFILSKYSGTVLCCANGGVGTTAYNYPWDRLNSLSRDPILCYKSTPCKNDKSCYCERKCDQVEQKVCGSDGHTYKNKCELLVAACKKKRSIDVSYDGECKANCKNVKCPNGKSCIFVEDGGSFCIERDCKCKPAGGKVCGINNKTYPTECHLKRAACKLHQVIPVKYYEQCNVKKTCKDITCKQSQACVTTSSGQPECIKCCTPKKNALKFKVCGSNGKLYDNWCEMRSDSCKTGRPITMDFPLGTCIKKNQKKQ